MSLNFWYIEARTLVKIIIEKLKERSSKGAKSDRWLSSGKESTVITHLIQESPGIS